MISNMALLNSLKKSKIIVHSLQRSMWCMNYASVEINLKPNFLSSKGWSRLVAVAGPAHYFLPQTAVCGRKYWWVQDLPLLLRPTPMEIKKIIHFSNVIKQNQTTSRPQTTPWNNYSMLNDHIIFYFVSIITNKNLDPTLLTTLCRPCTFLIASYASLVVLVVTWNREGKEKPQTVSSRL